MTSNKELAFRSSEAETLVCESFWMDQNQKFAPLEREKKQLIVVANIWELNYIC